MGGSANVADPPIDVFPVLAAVPHSATFMGTLP